MELVKVELAERFGWTFQEIDALSLEDLRVIIQVDDGRAKTRQKGAKVA